MAEKFDKLVQDVDRTDTAKANAALYDRLASYLRPVVKKFF